MWLDVKQTQHAETAFDVDSSLISISVSDATRDTLLAAARRIRCQMRDYDSVLLLKTVCALLLPATPFSGAQAVARRLVPLLSSFSCELHVYHGETALLVLQRLREAGARPVGPEECNEILSALPPDGEYSQQAGWKDRATPLPYLAFLTDYPAPHLLDLFPYELACHYQCVPVGSERRRLTLATYHWLNREVVTQLRAVTQREIFQVRCEIAIIDEVLRYWQRMQKLALGAESRVDQLFSPSR
ncbi:MAG TPA: hypothetical protein VGD98_02845 [Ktedonobacteraceae bacterium]